MNEETLFHLALEKPASERAAFLDEACSGDPALRRRIEILLQAHEHPASFLKSSIAGTEFEGTLGPPILLTPVGTIIGRYKLLEPIGEGGYGTVFMAEQTSPVQRKVALKIIKAGMDTGQVIARFEAERQALALMDHPNIARVFDAGTTDTGRLYFVMELVKGVPITEYCDRQKLSPRQRLELFIQVCQAVQHAHQKGIIHRDIKPTNVMVAVADDGKPVPKVIDFGIAKATRGQRLTDRTLFTELRQLIGTPLYMSPEQAEMSVLVDVDTRSDVYSLGVLLYELLTGTTPFDKQRLAKAAYEEVRRIIRDEEPPRPSTRLSDLGGDALTTISASRHSDPRRLGQIVRGELDWIVMRALEKDRNRRYETANGFARDVERYLSNEPVLACPPSRMYRLRKFARRNKALLATVSLIAVVLVMATVVSLWQKGQALAARAIAETSKREAEHQADEARRQNSIAQRRLAENYITQVHGLMKEGRYVDAKTRLAEAAEAYTSIGDEPLPADLLSLDLYAAAAPPLNRFDTQPTDRPEARMLPDGRTAILRRVRGGSRPGLAELVDLRTGQVLRTFVHDHGILATALSSDGDLLLTGGAEKLDSAATRPAVLTLWDVQRGLLIRRFVGHTDVVRYLGFSRDGRRAISSSIDKTIKIWDVNTGAIVRDVKTNRTVNYVAISPDGKLFATNSPGISGVLEVDTGTRRHVLPGIGTMVFSADGKSLLTGGQTTKVFELELGRTRELGGAPSVAFLPGEHQVLSIEGPQIYLRDAQTGQTYGVFTEPSYAHQLSVSDDGRYMTAGSSPGALTHWLLRKPVDILSIGRGGVLKHHQVVVTPDGRAAICPASRGIIKVWDLATGLLLRELIGGDSSGEALAVAVSPDGGRVLAGRTNGQLRLWDLASGRLIHTWQAHEPNAFSNAHTIETIAFSPDGRRAVSGGADAVAKVWDLETTRQVAAFRGHFKPNPVLARTVSSVAFTPDGTQVISSCDSDSETRVWDAATGREQRVLISRGQRTQGMFCLRVLNGGRVLTANDMDGIQLWDLTTGKELQHFPGNRAAATADGRLVASIVDGLLRVWEGATGRELLRSNYEQRVSSVDFSPDGRYIVCVVAGGLLNVRDLTRPARYRDFDRALPEARRTLQSNPNDAAALKVLGEWYAFRGVRDWAVEFSEKARVNGADVSSLELARSHLLSGNSDAALREFRAAIERREAPTPYLELCVQLAAAGAGRPRPTTAPSDVEVHDARWLWSHTIYPKEWEQDPQKILTLCRERVEQFPQDFAAWQTLGWALYRAGDYTASIEALEKSVSLLDQPKGGDPGQWFFLAMAHAKLEHRDVALAWYSVSIQWLGEDPAQDSSVNRMMRAEAAEVLGLPDRWPWLPQDADRRVYQRLLELSKDAEWPRRQLIWVDQALGSRGKTPATTQPATRPAATPPGRSQ